MPRGALATTLPGTPPCLEERHPEKDGLLVNLNAWEKKGGIASVWLLKTVVLWKPSNS